MRDQHCSPAEPVPERTSGPGGEVAFYDRVTVAGQTTVESDTSACPGPWPDLPTASRGGASAKRSGRSAGRESRGVAGGTQELGH